MDCQQREHDSCAIRCDLKNLSFDFCVHHFGAEVWLLVTEFVQIVHTYFRPVYAKYLINRHRIILVALFDVLSNISN